MIKRVDIRSRNGNLLSLPLDKEQGILLDEIEGLGPVKATLVSSSFAGQDGAQHHSSRRETRTIKLKMTLRPDYSMGETVEGLRSRVYASMMPTSKVLLQFYQHTGFRVDIQGVVETCDPPLFTDDPKIEVILVCFKPDFIDPNPKTVTGYTTEESVTTAIDYEGTVETGIVFKITPFRELPAFTIYHITSDGRLLHMDFGLPILANDVLTISTVKGDKYAHLVRDGNISSVVYGISPQAKWIELENGPNEIHVAAPGPPVAWELTRTDRYGGL